jgi:hypothetical protein
VTCYDIEDDKILVTLKMGWRGKDVQEFILEQPAVLQLEWNGKIFHPLHVGKETKQLLLERKKPNKSEQKEKNKKSESKKKKPKNKKKKKKSKKKQKKNDRSGKKNEL